MAEEIPNPAQNSFDPTKVVRGRGVGAGKSRANGRGNRGPKADVSPAMEGTVVDGVFVPTTGNELVEKTVFINRCAKVVKGGRRFSFSALLVIGDKKGRVGFGFGKANEVSEAIRKASEKGRKGLKPVAVHLGTIPHEVKGEHGGGYVILKPASPGTGIKAGGAVRAVCDAVGIKDIIAKSLGSSNHANVLKATLDALRQLRHKGDIYKTRGIPFQVQNISKQ
jgi:small subunit ribosomal protein S5